MTDILARPRARCPGSTAWSPAAAFPTATCSGPAKAGRNRFSSMRAARDEFAAFFARDATFTLGVCNGCQMLSALKELIPGRRALAALRAQSIGAVRGAPVLVRVPRSPSVLFAGMQESVLPVAVAHGEGWPNSPAHRAPASCSSADSVSLQFVDHRGEPTERYPFNPERLAAGARRRLQRRRPGHLADAASGAGVSHRADIVGAAGAGARTAAGCGCSAMRGCSPSAEASRAWRALAVRPAVEARRRLAKTSWPASAAPCARRSGTADRASPRAECPARSALSVGWCGHGSLSLPNRTARSTAKVSSSSSASVRISCSVSNNLQLAAFAQLTEQRLRRAAAHGAEGVVSSPPNSSSSASRNSSSDSSGR